MPKEKLHNHNKRNDIPPSSRPSPNMANGGDENENIPALKPGEKTFDVVGLKKMKVSELHEIARKFEVGPTTGMKKQDVIFKILQAQAERSGQMFGEGVL